MLEMFCKNYYLHMQKTTKRNPTEQDGEVLPMGSTVDMLSTMRPEDVDEEKETPMYEQYDALLHGTSRKKSDKILSVDFMRKYIHFVKILKPTLSEEASEIIADEYSKLRSEDMLENDVARTQPVTARTLETMIRLATAHAKARMSRSVTAQDAHAAIELVQYAYFKKVLEKEKKKRRRDSQSESEDEEMEPEQQRPKKRHTRQTTVEEGVEEMEPSQPEQTQETMEVDAPPSSITDERLTQFRTILDRTFRETRASALSLTRVRDSVNADNTTPFSQGEIQAALSQMTEANQVMLADGIVYIV